MGVVSTAAERPVRFAALRYPNFSMLWSSLIVSTAGAQMQQIAKSWLVLQQTNSPLALAALGLCYVVPTLALSATVTGPVADRFDRLALLKLLQVWGTFQPLLLALLLATGRLPLWLLFADTVATAALNAFNAPAQQALLPALVPPTALLSATALQSAVWISAQLLGPALGGVLLAVSGAAWVFAVNGLSTLAVLAALARLRGMTGIRETTPHHAPTPAGGLPYAWADPVLRALLLLTGELAMITGGYQLLLPLFARDILGGGAKTYGLLLAAPGVGAVLVTAVLAARDLPRRPATTCLMGALAVGGSLLGFAHAPSLPLGLALLVLAGASGGLCGTLLVTLLQIHTPDHLRGRIMATRYLASAGMSYAGGLLASGVVELVSPAMVITGGALAFVVCLAFLLRPLRAAERGVSGTQYM